MMVTASYIASLLFWFNEGNYDVWHQCVFTCLSVLVFYWEPLAGGLLTLIVIPRQYSIALHIVKALTICTNADEASFAGLPFISLNEHDGVWKWFKLRQLFVTERFDMHYNLCAIAVSAWTAFTMCFVLFLLLLQFVFQQSIFSQEWQLYIIVPVWLIVTVVYTLTAVTSVYLEQQKHTRILSEASAFATFSGLAANADRTPGVAPLTKASEHAKLLQQLQTYITNEPDCPHVFGIKVKPTFFYFILTYIGTAAAALIISELRKDIGA